MRVVHYVNQFFGGIGGEESAGSGLEERDGAVGPGRLLEQILGDDSTVVKTLVCGDNYADTSSLLLGTVRRLYIVGGPHPSLPPVREGA